MCRNWRLAINQKRSQISLISLKLVLRKLRYLTGWVSAGLLYHHWLGGMRQWVSNEYRAFNTPTVSLQFSKNIPKIIKNILLLHNVLVTCRVRIQNGIWSKLKGTLPWACFVCAYVWWAYYLSIEWIDEELYRRPVHSIVCIILQSSFYWAFTFASLSSSFYFLFFCSIFCSFFFCSRVASW